MPPTPADRLNELLTQSGSPPLTPEATGKFSAYLTLLQKWNTRTNLTAIRDEEGILSRHFLESILCAQKLPKGIVSLLDFGSGAGFPGIPIAILRPEISVTLAESQHKKAAFLREVVRSLSITAQVHSGRAETLTAHFDCVTLRAVDNMAQAIPAAAKLLTPTGWLAILTTLTDTPELQNVAAQSAQFNWQPFQPLPEGTQRILLLGQKEKIAVKPIIITIQPE